LPNIRLEGAATVAMPAASTESIVYSVQVPAGEIKPGRYDIWFDVRVADEEHNLTREHATFIFAE
jgi:hypothetical protein